MYRVETVWNVPTDKRSQNAGPFEKPSIQVSLIALEDDCNPVDLANDDLSNGTASRGAAAAHPAPLPSLAVCVPWVCLLCPLLVVAQARRIVSHSIQPQHGHRNSTLGGGANAQNVPL